MAERLPIPDELQHLIEKREQPTRRGEADRRASGSEPASTLPGEEGKSQCDAPVRPRRSGEDRRKSQRREEERP